MSGNTIRDVKFLGQTTLTTDFVPSGAAGTVNDKPIPLGGLSGVTYDAVNNRYYAISDDRSQNAFARFYTFTTNPDTIATSGVTFTNVTPIKDINNDFFTVGSLDPEGIALTQNGTVFISSEGEVNLNASRVINPFIKEFNLSTGQEVRSLPVPQKFLPSVSDTNNNSFIDAEDIQTSGVRNNLAFESLTITPDQKTLYTATENALLQDGPSSNANNSSRSRILQYNLVSGQPEKEYLYITDTSVEPNPAGGLTENGLVDLLAIDNRGTLLALERSFAQGVGLTIKIYEVSLQGVTDISTINSLNNLNNAEFTAIKSAQKRLLLNLTELELPTDANHPITGLDNIEGLAFGPKLADGRQSIVLVSDNNFSASQFTQILALSAEVIPTVEPIIETPSLLDNEEQDADADDPAIYLHPTDSAKSLLLTSVKNAGLRVYDLSGKELQTINPGNIRYNNIDLQYNFQLGSEKVDIAVASDRENDKLAIFKINPNATNGNYLEDITDIRIGTIFQALPFNPPFDPSAISAYGLTIYRSPVTNDYYVFVSRRETGDIAQLKLIDQGNGKIGAERVRNFTVTPPAEFENVDLQTEGMVVDQETGYLYIGQENVGIWKFAAEPNGSNTGKLIDKIKDLGGSNLTDDVEGLSIYYGKDGKGYLLVSSQGDNTFAVYSREGNNDFIGRFAVGNNGLIDSVQESDGADVINVSLGANFPFGLFVTQDGNNDPAKIVIDDGEEENINSNFKLVPWEGIANLFPEALTIDPTSYNPRNPVNRISSIQDVKITETGGSTNVTEAGVTDSYSLVLTSKPTANVNIILNKGNQLITSTTNLVFTPENWNVAQNVTVAAVDNQLVDGNRRANIQHTINSNDPKYNNLAINSVNVNIADNDIPLAKITDDIFKISSNLAKAKLKITLTGRNSNLVNELGAFTVDDVAGKIDGIAPGTAGYTEAALKRAKVIFSAITNNPNGFTTDNITRLLEFNSGESLRFYLIKNSSFDAVNAGITSTTNILFSNSVSQKITDLAADGFSLAWQDGSKNTHDFNDLVVKINHTEESLVLGTNLQGKFQGELIDLRSFTSQVKAEFILNREAAFNNYVSFYQVADENGGIDTNGDGKADILPGQTGYLQAAVRGRLSGIDLTVNNQSTATFMGNLQPGGILAPLIIVNGRPDAVLDSNTNNDPAVYFPFLGANPDKVDHIRLLGDNIFGFEDLPNGGDQDFNDVTLKVKLSIT